MRGEFEKSIAIYEQALAQAETSGDKSEVMRFATLLANAVLDAGNLGRAQELLGRAITIADQVQNPLDRARLWWTQSRLHDSQGQPDLAARYAKLALAVLEEHDQTAAAGIAHLLLAYIENERGDADAALESLQHAEQTISSGGDRFHQALLQIERARSLLLKGEQEQAASLAMGALPHVLQASAIDSGRAQALLGDVFRELGDRERAQELYELALETLPSVDSNLIRVYGGLAALLEEAGRELEGARTAQTGNESAPNTACVDLEQHALISQLPRSSAWTTERHTRHRCWPIESGEPLNPPRLAPPVARPASTVPSVARASGSSACG